MPQSVTVNTVKGAGAGRATYSRFLSNISRRIFSAIKLPVLARPFIAPGESTADARHAVDPDEIDLRFAEIAATFFDVAASAHFFIIVKVFKLLHAMLPHIGKPP